MDEQMTDIGPLARTVVLWVWIWLAAQSLFGLASLYQLTVLSGVPDDLPVTFDQSPPELAVSDMVVGLAAILSLLAFLVSGFLVLRWIHRANRNAQAVAGDMTISPGWNVGWFFVPIANLWKPFQGVRETWQVSHGGRDWQDVPVPAFMRWWWGCWLAMNMIDNLSFRLSLRADTTGDMMLVSIVDTVSAAIGVPLALLLIALVRRLSAAQTAMLHGETFA